MTGLEQKAEEYLVNHFCKKVDKEYMIEECKSGERIRCIAFEERKEMLIEFAKERQEQIEKMKCCCNCKHYRGLNGEDWCDDHYGQPVYDEDCKDKWELAE